MSTSQQDPSFSKSRMEPKISSSCVQTQAQKGVLISAAFLLFFLFLAIPPAYRTQ